ncbi:hypothetical protein GPJ56_003376 [Histomonas meleagridis]|uniref:uncharacterized protein n=1 Tax=Histomonas meleagridis TaxID=135588 RepID=UPI0035598570|nr:hypothetical protein GPJ56_003376 [Histomonas meleagridis]KAH0804995.1 hypothetical protein GO595_001940 [Histomonas meleagridis]
MTEPNPKDSSTTSSNTSPPPLGGNSSTTAPQVNNMPSILPTLPTLPALPTIPTIPVPIIPTDNSGTRRPSIDLTIPAIPIPEIPNVPSNHPSPPSISMPTIPNGFQLPTIPIPSSTPTIPIPEIPSGPQSILSLSKSQHPSIPVPEIPLNPPKLPPVSPIQPPSTSVPAPPLNPPNIPPVTPIPPPNISPPETPPSTIPPPPSVSIPAPPLNPPNLAPIDKSSNKPITEIPSNVSGIDDSTSSTSGIPSIVSSTDKSPIVSIPDIPSISSNVNSTSSTASIDFTTIPPIQPPSSMPIPDNTDSSKSPTTRPSPAHLQPGKRLSLPRVPKYESKPISDQKSGSLCTDSAFDSIISDSAESSDTISINSDIDSSKLISGPMSLPDSHLIHEVNEKQYNSNIPGYKINFIDENGENQPTKRKSRFSEDSFLSQLSLDDTDNASVSSVNSIKSTSAVPQKSKFSADSFLAQLPTPDDNDTMSVTSQKSKFSADPLLSQLQSAVEEEKPPIPFTSIKVTPLPSNIKNSITDKATIEHIKVLLSPHLNKFDKVEVKTDTMHNDNIFGIRVGDENQLDKEKLQTFPINNPEKVTSFICNNGNGFFIFRDKNYEISLFMAKSLNEEYKLCKVNEVPKIKNEFSIFNLPNDRIGLLGGNDDDDKGLQFWAFHHGVIPQWEKVRLIGSVFPNLSYHSSACVTENGISYIYTFGGKKNNELFKKLLLMIYQNGAYTYREFIPQGILPPPRAKCTFTLYKNKIYLFGGVNETSNLMSDFWALNLTVNGLLNPVWEHMTCDCPPPRCSHQAYVSGDYLYVAGGYNEKGDQYNDIWKFDGVKWTLSGAFDSSKYVYSSSFGLIKFSNKFELEPILHPNIALNSKYKILYDRRDEYLRKKLKYSNKIYSEIDKIQRIRTLMINMDSKPFQVLLPEIKTVFNTDVHLSHLKHEFMKKANSILETYKIHLNEKTVSTEFSVNKIIEKLEEKLKQLNFTQNLKSTEHKEQLEYFQQQLIQIKQLETEPLPQHLFNNEFKQNLEEILNSSDNKSPGNQNLLSYYYIINQQITYEHNKKIIEHIQQQIQHYKEKLFNKTQIISDLLRRNSKIRSETETMKKNIQNWNNLFKQIIPQREFLQEYHKLSKMYQKSPDEFKKNLNELLESNRQIQEKIIAEIEDVVSKKYKLEDMFSAVADLKSFYKRNNAHEIEECLTRSKPIVLKMMDEIYPQPKDEGLEEFRASLKQQNTA